ncbi:hypothetical protein [Salinimonas sediminis]|uniref:hypothetical protein n=1 Tax=Salinimonas sediminis TaxID=2303538 RepID=UPI001473E01D|nr:hypothetical protein [Salinimonas sediminis]
MTAQKCVRQHAKKLFVISLYYARMTQHIASFGGKRNDARNQASAVDVLPVEPTFSRTW